MNSRDPAVLKLDSRPVSNGIEAPSEFQSHQEEEDESDY